MTAVNPYRTALAVVGIAGVSVGILLLLVGVAIYNTNLNQGVVSDTPSDAVIVWGCAITGVGVVGVLLWLAVAAIGWQQRTDTTEARQPSDAQHVSS